MKIFGDGRSGNCLKVKYVADILGAEYEWQEIDVLSGYTRTEEYLAINAAGQIPAVQFSDGRVLAQSNAIMLTLAERSNLVPEDSWARSKMYEWLFWEQYTHEPSIAVIRFQVALKRMQRQECDQALVAKGEAALDLMERHLKGRDFFVGNQLSLADIGLYAYTQFAEEGGFSLFKRPNISSWLDRVQGKISA